MLRMLELRQFDFATSGAPGVATWQLLCRQPIAPRSRGWQAPPAGADRATTRHVRKGVLEVPLRWGAGIAGKVGEKWHASVVCVSSERSALAAHRGRAARL